MGIRDEIRAQLAQKPAVGGLTTPTQTHTEILATRPLTPVDEPTAREIMRDAAGRIVKGFSGNPGGMSKEKKDYLQRLRSVDAPLVYSSLMQLVAEGNVVATVRAFEYIVGKPKEVLEVSVAPGVPQLDFSKLTLEQKLQLERLMVLASPMAAPLPELEAAVPDPKATPVSGRK